MDSNSLSYVGLAYKAGKVIAGTAACEFGLKKGNIKLLLIQDEMAENSKKKLKSICAKIKVDVFEVSGYYRLGQSIGKEGILVVGVTDAGFAGVIKGIFVGGQGSGDK